MIFATTILIFLAAIVFFHYIQGFFSATISAILTIFAAVIAFSYHEMLVPLFGGKMADYSTAICLLALFGITYLLMRILFDKVIPGNIRLPVAVDKGGAVVMGLISGIFATGIMAIAAQEFPFGPEIGGFSRFDSESERQQKVEPRGKSAFYSKVWGELSDNTPGEFGEPDSSHGVPIIPVDSITMNLISKLSSPTGSLQNDKPLESVHPDFLTEMLGNRVGIEPTGTHVATNARGAPEQVKVLGVFDLNPKTVQSDGEITRKQPLKLPVLPKSNEQFLVVRIMFAQTASDSDMITRFSPGSIRIVGHDPNGSDANSMKDYYPIGTMEATGRIFVNKVDDYIFCKQGNGVDAVFIVPKTLIDNKGAIKDGTFIVVKRDARIDMSGMKVEPTLTPNADILVQRKELVLHPELGSSGGPPLPPPTPTAAPATPPAAPAGQKPTSTPPAANNKPAGTSSGLTVVSMTSDAKIPVNAKLPAGQVPGGGFGKIEAGKVKNINMDASSLELKMGDALEAFDVPAGQAMIQVKVTPSGPSAWGFATDPEQYEIVDSTGKHYQPNGVVAIFRSTTGERVMMRYIQSQTISGVAAPTGADAPSEAYILYVVPANTSITEFDDHGQKAKAENVVAK